jgi:predicted dehydrogenase
MKVLVIGCGMISGYFEDPETAPVYSHAKAYLRVFGKNVQLGFCDPDASKVLSMSEKFSGKALSADLQKAIAEFQPDVVSVCTPDQTHAAIIEEILRNPQSVRLVFAEKPICQTRSELEKLMTLEEKSRAKIIVNHSRRFDQAHVRLREIILSGMLGKLIRTDIDYYGGLVHLGVHVVDYLLYLFGGKALLARSTEYCCESKYKNDETLDVSGTLNGAPFTMKGVDEKFYQTLEFNLKFEKGLIRIEDFGNEIRVFTKTINTENENVLVLHEAFQGMRSPILNAVKVIQKYIESKSLNTIEPYGLKQASDTMNALWNIRECYEKTYR